MKQRQALAARNVPATPTVDAVRPSLRRLLRRAYMALALGAVAIVGLTLGVPAILTLRIYADHDVRLVARALGYTMEAAAVFGDSEAAQEALSAAMPAEDVAEATVTAADGRVLARWRNAETGPVARLESVVSRLVHAEPVVLPIRHDGGTVGEIRIRSGGRMLLRVFAFGLLGIVACQLLIVAAALYFARSILGRIVQPLQALAAMAGTVGRERAFGQRVPGAQVRELHELGVAFNVLRSELDDWHTLMQGEHDRLSHQATHDSLTGLPNRAFFEGRFHRALDDARVSGTRLAVLIIDCDKFKAINDRHGHAAGDAVLVAVAARVRGQMRERDLIARLGGDEFAGLIAPVQDAGDVRRLREAIAGAAALPIDVGGGVSVQMSISIGIAVFPDDGASAAELLLVADGGMYRAKRSGSGPDGVDRRTQPGADGQETS